LIAESTEIKDILNITSTEYDSRISTLRPIVQNDLFNYLKNDFNPEYSRKTTGETLGTGTTGTDTFSFDEDVFEVDALYVGGSSQSWEAGSTEDYIIDRNDYSIEVYSLGDGEELSADYKYPVYPYGLKLVYADMIEWRLSERNPGYKSEKLSRYSYTKSDMTEGYPNDILKSADKWKKVGFVWP